MSWADSLRAGSFRGAPFKFMDAGGNFGRRGQLHEYPTKDDPWFEDLGRQARGFTLEVVTVGPTYAADRDRLIKACEAKGPGLLVHPLWGEMKVVCQNCLVQESTHEGGVARFTLTFIGAGKFGSAALGPADTAAAAGTAAGTTRTAAVNSFASTYSTANQPSFVVSAALADVTSTLHVLQGLAAARDATSLAAYGFSQQITQSLSLAGSLASDPSTLGASIAGIVRCAALTPGFGAGSTRVTLVGTLDPSDATATASIATAALIDNPAAGVAPPADVDSAIADVRSNYLALSTLDPSYQLMPGAAPPDAVWTAPVESTPARQAQADNQAALLALVRQIALAGAVRATALTTFASYDDAVAARDDIAARIDAEMLAATDDALFSALSAMRIATVRDISARAVELPRLVTYTPPSTLPAVVIAHRLYDDPSWADDIVARNDIHHPGFLAGGQALKVLNNV